MDRPSLGNLQLLKSTSPESKFSGNFVPYYMSQVQTDSDSKQCRWGRQGSKQQKVKIRRTRMF